MLDWLRYLGFFGEMIGFLWLVQILGILFLLWRRRWLGALVLMVPASLTFLVGGTSWPARLIAEWERPYAITNFNHLPARDVVIVLGGGHRPSDFDLYGIDLTPAADRLLTGLELLRLHKARVLVLGGGTFTGQGKKQEIAQRVRASLVSWGCPNVPVYTLGESENTREEAMVYQGLARSNRWRNAWLVSSAFHLRRAEAVFKNFGLEVSSIGCDFRGLGIREPEKRFLWIPRRERFEQMDWYVHEWIGYHLYQWRGWTVDNSPVTAPSPPVPR